MAKKTDSSVQIAGKKISFDFLIRISVSLLFVCMGIKGFLGNTDGIYNIFDSEGLNYIIGILLLLSGVAVFLPMFIKGISKSIVSISSIVMLVAWILVIVFADFEPGFKNMDGKDIVLWIEQFSVHLIVLGAIIKNLG